MSESFDYTDTVETITIATTGTYEILAAGAQGGGSDYDHLSPGKGAVISGEFSLTAGEVIEVVVGGSGEYGALSGGGGGGSFVFETSTDGSDAVHIPLVIAGGGGGAGFTLGATGYSAGLGGTIGTTGGSWNGYNSGTPGSHGAGGSAGYSRYGESGDGGGYSGGSANSNFGSFGGGGRGFGYGYAGGIGTAGGLSDGYGVSTNGGNGGFGGGGGSGGLGGGGGGGFGGGAGGGYQYQLRDPNPIETGGGGGGGSFDGGSDQVLVAGAHAGDGEVTLELLCYLRGTHILTPGGEVFVETLRIGDPVVTRFGGVRPVKWIGRQSYDLRFVRNNRDRLPVCIRAGALGDDLPARDLYVSPGHSMLLEDQLVLAQALVNGVTITQDWSPAEIHYYQIELETHDCVRAEGAWAESFADADGLRGQFHNAAEFHRLYPHHRAPEELRLCAPRPERGAALDAVLRRVVARSGGALKPGPLEGSIDRVGGSLEIDGWALDLAHPEHPVLLEVVLGERVIATVLACDYRRDLEQAGKGHGRCAFFFEAPVELRAELRGMLRIRRASDHAEITMSLPCREMVKAA